MLKILKVTGNSLSPSFYPGDFVIILRRSLFSQAFQPGDYIVFDHSEYGLLIKKISEHNRTKDHYVVHGTHHLSINSDQLGPISSSVVLGKVLWHIKNPSKRPDSE